MKDSVPGTDLREPWCRPRGTLRPGGSRSLPQRAGQDGGSVQSGGQGPRRADRVGPFRHHRGRAASSPPSAISRASTPRSIPNLLLRDETRTLAWSQVIAPDGAALPTGLGWFVQTYHGERLVWQFGEIPGAYSALVLKLPARHLTFILLANSDGLSAPFQLQSGDVTRSPFATLFLRLVS